MTSEALEMEDKIKGALSCSSLPSPSPVRFLFSY